MKNNPREKSAAPAAHALSAISLRDLEALGVGDVGYLKRHVINGRRAVVLYAADGTALAAQSNEDEAEQSASYHDLNLVTVH